MSFLKKLLIRNKEPQKQQKTSMIVMESDTLGMTVIEETDGSGEITRELSNDEWVQIISSKKLNGVPYNRLYFSFLKGIPTFLRMKIWLMLCTQQCSRNYNFIGTIQKRYSQEIELEQSEQKDKLFSIFSIKVFKKLSQSTPPQKQVDQIIKDVHRTYSNKQKYLFTSQLLRKILFALSNSGVQYSQGMNYILLNVIIYCLQSIGIGKDTIQTIPIQLQRDIFIILRQIVLRLQEVFQNNNIFKVIKELEQKISQTVPDVLYNIYKMGMDSYSLFSQHYYSLLTYSDPPEQLCKQMMDLFFLEGEKAITAVVVRMLEIAQDQILRLKQPEDMQKFVKIDIFHFCFKTFCEQKQSAKSINDFGLSFYQNVTKY